MFHGTLPAIITPFRQDGSIDEKALRGLITFLIENGVNGIVPCGTTGESATLTHEEHKEVIRITVEAVNGRVPVLAGTGSNSTAETIDLTRAAKKAGADGALLISPYYNKPSQEGIYQHYRKIAEETAFPLVLYNVPGRTSLNILPETVARLSKIGEIIGIKEASADLHQISRIIDQSPEGFLVLSGDDFTVLPTLAIGGRGVISVVANTAPKDMSEMVSAFFRGDLNTARKLHYKLLDLTGAMFLETNPLPVKTALHLMGKCEETFRLPLCPMGEGTREKLTDVLKGYQLMMNS
ncbi:MAG: 4-hydroxy-tetrahydrodipicolinate synthase [Deltaproteobacteria bacterium]|nr:4-hydroxy-tetrahydrodipicolinate synthase [Deltaproteobacteria bacterium]